MFLKIINIKKMCINYTKYITWKISEKLYCLNTQKIFVQTKNLASKIKNICEACILFMLECIYYIKLCYIINLFFTNRQNFFITNWFVRILLCFHCIYYSLYKSASRRPTFANIIHMIYIIIRIQNKPIFSGCTQN